MNVIAVCCADFSLALDLMRMSCNGCRVLRKGCSESCVLRPCLEWIKTEESQGNAVVFLAKFYGRTGLITLIANAPPHSRPALFRSLLYEACGRQLNPVYGSVGLLSSGNWALCEAGVECILEGSDLIHNSNLCDHPNGALMQSISGELQRVKDRGKFKWVHPHTNLKFRERREFINDIIEISSGETQGRGFDIRKTSQDNSMIWRTDVYSSAKEKCASSCVDSQHPDDLEEYNFFHTPNAQVEATKSSEVEVELELTLGALKSSSPPNTNIASCTVRLS
ncbi:uncharacterized protein LOC131048530 isoform X1 [Cryptomeria japonica]|uniref:uncharacterized protein LOC131048530 isoform X1 n=2 Tax=Cryptomeria japonica TaxID=3369 RepID=UPI0027DA684A|nr:uncharacterized protein LOC131048530 isoform X1 [Cryptomeria japonica]